MYQYLDTPENDNFKPQYRFLDGVTASGKSSAVCSHLRRFIGYRNQIIVCEKIALLEEWDAKLKSIGVNAHLIHGDGASAKVAQWFRMHTDITGTGVLLCTQAALSRVARISMKHDCDVFFDELPTICNVVSEKFHTSAVIIKEHVKLGRTRYKRFTTDIVVDGKRQRNQPDSLRKAIPVDEVSLRKYLKDSSHVISDELRRLFDLVLSDYQEVYIKELAFNWLGEVKSNKDDLRHKGKTTFVAMTNDLIFKGWGCCTVISSDFECSLFKHWFGNRLNFRRSEILHSKLLNNGKHPSSWIERTQFNYLTHPDEKRGLNSKFWLESNGCQNGNKLDERLKAGLNNEPVLLCTNVSRSKRRFARQTNVKIITSKDIGVNEYSEFTNVVFDAALNQSPEVESILKMLGIELDVLRTENIFNVAYQVVSRGNLRTNRDGKNVSLYFADKPTCDYVMSRFANKAGQVANVRHVGDDSYQAVNVVPNMPPVEYSKRFNRHILRLKRKAIRLYGNSYDGILHPLGHSTRGTSVASREAISGTSDKSDGGYAPTSSYVASDIDLTLPISSVNSEMSENHGGIYYKPPQKLDISDLPTKSDWVAYFHYDETGLQTYQKSKLRQLITGIQKKSLASTLICPIVTGERFFYSNFGIIEFSADKCNKDEFIKHFNPVYSGGDNRRVSFLVSEQGGVVQVVVFFKTPVASWKRYKEKLTYIESKLGFELSVHQEQRYRLQEGFTGFNCKEKINLTRHSL